MPNTTDTGGKPAPKPQTAKRSTPKPKLLAAPAAIAPTPTPTPTGESMFDDMPPAPPAAERPPVERAAPSEPPAAPDKAIDAEAMSDAAQADPVPPAPPSPGPTPEVLDQGDGREDTAKKVEPSGSPARVRLGRAEGVLHRVPLEVVQELVAQSGSRIATLQNSPAIADLQARMRVSEGRCAPIIFTMAEGDDVPRLFAGLEAVAAAINLGLETVSVVTVAAGDAGLAQAHLAGRAYHTDGKTQGELVEFIE